MDAEHERETVQFWFDPVCPWAWITSRWMLEVEKVRPVETEWKIMSLAYLNLVQRAEEPLTAEYKEMMTQAWGPVRVCAAAEKERGPEILLPLYSALGRRFHEEDRWAEPAAVAEALEEVGLDPALGDAATSDALDEVIVDSHLEAFDEVGLDVGTPVIRAGGHAFFGPVMSPAPKGEAAGRLFDAFVVVASTDGVFELKRTRDREPIFG